MEEIRLQRMTRAEQLAIEYAFRELGMNAVNADAVKKNIRSQRVLEKVGFKLVNEDNDFRYYRIER
ncbi:MAG: GNAT family N-acetyltransferase [Butyrivibrio sp.]|nr:GNAT family N-acetyltransferase [Butyrivibrio sp.]